MTMVGFHPLLLLVPHIVRGGDELGDGHLASQENGLTMAGLTPFISSPLLVLCILSSDGVGVRVLACSLRLQDFMTKPPQRIFFTCHTESGVGPCLLPLRHHVFSNWSRASAHFLPLLALGSRQGDPLSLLDLEVA